MIGPNGGQDILQMEKNDWGILPRAAEFLLNYLNEKSEEGILTFEAKASFLQVYNENLYDLLRDSGPMINDHLILNDRDKNSELKIREVPKPKSQANTMRDNISEMYISGLSEFRVQTGEDVIRMLAFGTSNRMTRSTDFNLTSSRSHAILQLTFEIETQVDSGQTLMSRSKLYLVDLAGSEKIPYISTDNPKHLKELTSINKSLSTLGHVISALASTTRSHIPYRDSKLTRILQDSLGGNTRTILIACVAPTIVHSPETLSTLQFADRAKHVRITVKANTVVDDKVTLAKAQAEITRLKALLGHALKQLEEKSSSLGLTARNIDMLELSEENERLKRENQSLKKLMKTASLPMKATNKQQREISSPTSDSSLYKYGSDRDGGSVDGDGKSKNKKNAAFMSGVDRFGRPSFDNVGNYLKAAGKMKKLNNLREMESESGKYSSMSLIINNVH
jgi:regulator of replication initiation timing